MKLWMRRTSWRGQRRYAVGVRIGYRAMEVKLSWWQIVVLCAVCVAPLAVVVVKG